MSNALAAQSLLHAVQSGLALSPESAAAVATELEPVTCRGGEWLFRQDDPADGLYLLVRGRLQVWIEPAEGEGKGPRLVAEVAPGETIGEIGLLSGGPRSASIRAMRDSLLLRMDTDAFDRIALRNPGLTRHLAGGIATRLRDRTAGGPTVRRQFAAVALLPLDDGPATNDLVERLAHVLAARGPVRILSSQGIAAMGGIALPERPGAPVSPQTVDWLAS